MWSGNTTQARTPNGRSAIVCRTATRSRSTSSTSSRDPASARQTVKNTDAPGTLMRRYCDMTVTLPDQG
jgi:hypothetical protein